MSQPLQRFDESIYGTPIEERWDQLYDRISSFDVSNLSPEHLALYENIGEETKNLSDAIGHLTSVITMCKDSSSVDLLAELIVNDEIEEAEQLMVRKSHLWDIKREELIIASFSTRNTLKWMINRLYERNDVSGLTFLKTVGDFFILPEEVRHIYEGLNTPVEDDFIMPEIEIPAVIDLYSKMMI